MNLKGTTKQLQVAGLLVQGLKGAEIGAQLGMRPRTVKVHVNRLAYKNGIRGKHIAVLLVAKMTTEPAPMPSGLLKSHQKEICELVSLGYTNLEIAKQTGFTEQTIKNYLRTIFDLTGVWNRNELAGWWISHNLPLDKPEIICNYV